MSSVPRRFGGIFLEWAGWAFVIAVFGAPLLPAVQQDRSSRRSSRSYAKQIGLALANYHDVYGSFPPAITYGPDGKPWHSWRVLLMPYLEAGPWYAKYRFDEPWNGPHNRTLAAEIGDLPCYRCPADTEARPGTTSYLAVVGAGTMWPPHGAVSLDDVTDDKAETIQVIEVADSGVHWMEPRDLEFDRLDFAGPGPAVRGPHGGTTHWFGTDDPRLINAEFADGSVRTLDPAKQPAAFRSMLLRADGGPK